MKKVFLTISILLILLGIAVRSVELISGNYLFTFDQGNDYLSAMQIVDDHKFTLIGNEAGAGFLGINGIFHGPGYRYLLALAYFIFQGDPYGGIVFVYILNIISLVLIYLITTKIFSKNWGVMATLFASISPPLISQARFVWAPHFGFAFIVLAFLSIYNLKHHRLLQIFLTGWLAATLYNFELQYAVVFVITLFFYQLFILQDKKVRYYLTAFLGIILGFLPMILFEIRHGMNLISGVIKYLETGGGGLFNPIKEFINDGKSFIHIFADTFPGMPENWLYFFIFLALFISFLCKEKNNNIRQWVQLQFLFFIVSFVVYYFYRGPVYPHYLVPLYATWIFVAIYILYRLYYARYYFVLALLILMFSISLVRYIPLYIHTIQYDYHDYGGTAKIKAKVDAVDFIYQQANGKPFGLFIFSPPVYTYPYDYVFKWYGKRKYGYLPKPHKSGEFYLLIEPDPGKPWSYNGWLETVIKNGSVENRWQLASGLIVEKRYEKE